MAKKQSVDLRDERKKEQIKELYRTRLSHLKRAQILVRDDKMAQAVDSYTKYLGILALYFDVTEDRLSPSMFDPEKDLTELLLISHAYWDLSKAFDRSPNLQRDCFRCLEQFVKFSIGFKYQHVNAQIVRKFNNKKQAHNPKAFEAAYQRIQVSSKKCYIATSCFGENHYHTDELRKIKSHLAKSELGLDFIDFYYQYSPVLVEAINNHRILKMIESILIKPVLILISHVHRFACRF
jgi:hypothetical protein